MSEPSTNWREVVGPDEVARHEALAEALTQIQQLRSVKFGRGRALHRKPVVALQAELEVLPNLPVWAAQGLFTRPVVYEAWLRLSNGGMDVASDRAPDIRGFSIKVRGVHGAGALGGMTDCQDFLLINHDRFSFASSEPFGELVVAAANGPLAALRWAIGRYGFVAGLKTIFGFQRVLGKAFSGFATEAFCTVTPFACGPYAVRLRVVPAQKNPSPLAAGDWAGDIARRLEKDVLSWDVQLQPFVDEAVTPIEDAKAGWAEADAPWTTVGRLIARKQALNNPAARMFAQVVEAEAFDPWRALAAHRPLGEVMRARKVAYWASQQARRG